MTWVEVLAIAYSIAGLIKVVLYIPALKKAWHHFDEDVEENFSLWEKRNITEDQYLTAKYMIFFLAVFFTWLAWPLPHHIEEAND